MKKLLNGVIVDKSARRLLHKADILVPILRHFIMLQTRPARKSSGDSTSTPNHNAETSDVIGSRHQALRSRHSVLVETHVITGETSVLVIP
jgi:hypothetical protein